MKAIQVIGPKQLKVVDVPEPQLGPGQVLVRTETVSICGSDMRQFRTILPEERYPLPPGRPCHEVVGIVEKSDSPDAIPGQRVIALVSPGQPATNPGGGAEYMVSTPDRITVLPEGADPATYIMCQPVGTVLWATKHLNNVLGKTVVVLGQGAIGLAFTDLIRRMGPRQLIAVDRHDYRLTTAQQRGATTVLNPLRDDIPSSVADLTNGIGADAVVEASGTPEAINQMADLIKQYGQIILFGLPEEDLVEIEYFKLMRKMPTIVPTVSASDPAPSDGIKEAVSMVQSGDLDVSWLVTHQVSFDDAPQAYSMYADYLDNVIKVVMQVS